MRLRICLASVIVAILGNMTACACAEADPDPVPESCTPQSHDPDMVPLASLTAALEKLKEMDEKVRRKVELVKDIRSRHKYQRETISKLTNERDSLKRQLDEMKAEMEAAQLTRSQVDADTEKQIWKLGIDLKHCKEDEEDLERQSEAWNKEVAGHYTDMRNMHVLERTCRKDLKACNNDKAVQDKRLATLDKMATEGGLVGCVKPDDVTNFSADVTELHKKLSDGAGNEFIKMMMERYGLCLYNSGFIEENEAKSIVCRKEFDLEAKIKQITTDANKALSKCRSELDKAALKIKMGAADAGKLEGKLDEHLAQINDLKLKLHEAEKVSLKKMKKRVPDKESAIREKYGFLSDKIKGKIDPFKPYTVPDVLDMELEEGKQIFEEFRNDYNWLFDIAHEASESFTVCQRQKQDFKIMKYFLTKYLIAAREEKSAVDAELAELKQNSSEATSGQLSEEEFDIMKSQRNSCLDDIKELRRKSTADSRVLKFTREDLEKEKREGDKHKEWFEMCKGELDSLEMYRKGTSLIIQEMEDTEEKHKKVISDGEASLEAAIENAIRFRLYFTLSLLGLVIIATVQLYQIISRLIDHHNELTKAAKKQEKMDSKSKARGSSSKMKMR